MFDGGKALDRPPGDALRRRISRHQIGVLGLQPFELVQQTIELLVGDLRVVVDVVALFVVADGITKLGKALFRRGLGHTRGNTSTPTPTRT
jgi:hypothetical protein